MFLKFAGDFGVPKESLFQTVDLYEERDVGMVCIQLKINTLGWGRSRDL